MSPEEMKAKVRHYITEIWYNHNLDAMDDVFHPDCVAHSDPPTVGIEASKQSWRSVLQVFSEPTVEFPHQVVEGDLVVSHITVSVKHTGVFAGVQPAGKTIHTKATLIQRFENGVIVEAWPFTDILGMMQQFGYRLVLDED